MAEGEGPRRQRLRIERDPIKQRRLRNEFVSVLKSAYDDDAARYAVEFIGSHRFAFEGC